MPDDPLRPGPDDGQLALPPGPDDGQLALPPGPVRKALGPGTPDETTVDPVRIRWLGQIYNKIRSVIQRSSNLTLQLIAVLHELKKGVSDEPTLTTSEGRIQKRIDKVINDLRLFDKNLRSESINLDGLENTKAYFKCIMVDMNKILTELGNVSSLKDYIRRAGRIALTLRDSALKELSKAVRILKSGSRDYIGNKVGELTMSRFVQQLVLWKKKAGRIRKNDEGDTQSPDVAVLKDLYREIAMGFHPDRTNGYDEGTRERLKDIFQRAVPAYKSGDHQELVRLRDEMNSVIGDRRVSSQKALPDGTSQRATLKPGTDIDALESILSIPIAIPRSRRGIFVSKKKVRELNVPQFASYVLFSNTANKSSDAYKLREQVVSIIPNAFVQLGKVRKILDHSNYYVKNAKNYKAFVEQYDTLMKFKPKIDQLANGMRAGKLRATAERAYNNLVQDSDFNQLFLSRFGQRATTGGWDVVFADPKKLAFILEYPRKDSGQKLLWRYFNLAYDALISLDAMLNKLKDGPVRQIKKDLNNP